MTKKKKTSPRETTNPGTRFTLDLGEIDLTEEEVNGLGNEIARLAIARVREKGDDDPFGRVAFIKNEFAKIIHK